MESAAAIEGGEGGEDKEGGGADYQRINGDDYQEGGGGADYLRFRKAKTFYGCRRCRTRRRGSGYAGVSTNFRAIVAKNW